MGSLMAHAQFRILLPSDLVGVLGEQRQVCKCFKPSLQFSREFVGAYTARKFHLMGRKVRTLDFVPLLILWI